ncbi:MAG: filamentous hemagglutinin N-terminal domain-containing protein [Acetobacteraceae bacterium]
MSGTDAEGRDKAGTAAPQPVRWRVRSVLLLTTALQAASLSPALAQPAPNARPTGGQVAAGQASIAQTQATTTVNQASQRAAVNWQSFDVGANHTVRFQQPSANAVTLNRVVGPNPSEIAGRIQANGQVVVVNQSGVLFHKGAQVDTAGLVVSAAGISNSNFMAGRMVFDQPAKPGAKVENRGTITLRQQGLAALVAPQVANSGVISAKMGTVILAGAEAHTLDLYGDGMVSINVTRQVRTMPDGKQVLVTNTGTVAADGGRVLLTAEAVDGVVQTLVNASGQTRANTVGDRTGQVAIAGRGGNVIVAGSVVADGGSARSRGGRVAINATGTVAVTATARISASGPGGGGTLAVGTTLARAAGGPAVSGQPTSRAVTVARGATLVANATIAGKGGTITVLSSDTTRMNGTVQARGGSQGGDGGSVELSGGRIGSTTGQVDVGAPAGRQGSILLDPDVLTIVDATSGSGSQDATFSVTSGTIAAGDPSIPPDTISNGVLNAFTGDVVLQANQSILVQGNVGLNRTTGQSLLLQAGGTIVVETGIVLSASGNVTLATGGAGGGTPPAAQPAPLISVLGTVMSGSGTVSLLGGIDGTVSVAAAGLVSAPLAALTTTGAGSIAVDGTVSGATSATLASGTGGVSLNNGAVLTGGTIAIQAAGPIVAHFGARIGQSGAVVDLSTTSGGITQDPGAVITAHTLRSSLGVTGNTALMGVNNVVDTIGSFAVGGAVTNNFTLIAATDIRVDGPLSAPGNVAVGTFGKVVLAGPVTAGDILLALATTDGVTLESGANVEAPRIALIANNGSISMAAGASLGRSNALVDLTATGGGVTQDSGAVLTAATLRSANGVAGAVDLAGTANAIATIAGFAVSGSANGFRAITSGNLGIAGPLTAPGEISLTTGTSGQIIVAGSIGAGTTLGLQGGSLGVALNNGAILSAPTLIARTPGGILIDGGAVMGQTGAVVDLSAGSGITQSAAGTLIAERLRSSYGVTGTVALAGSANAVGTIASFAVAGGGLSLHDTAALRTDGVVSSQGDLTLVSTAAGGITLGGTMSSTGSLTLSGTAGPIALNTGAVVTGPAIVARAGTDGMTIAAGATLGQAGATLDLGTTGGGVTQDPAAVIRAKTILSATGVGGSIVLPGSANAIDGLGQVAVTGGGLSVLTTGSLTVGGPVAASGDIALHTAGSIGIGGSIGAGGKLALTSDLAGIALGTGATAGASTITLAAQGPISIGAGARLGRTGATVDIGTTTGGITQDTAGTVIAGVLRSTTGIAGDVSLLGTNTIGSLDGIALSGSGAQFLLADIAALTITGTVAVPSGTVYLRVSDAAGVTVAATGGIETTPGGAVAIQAPALAIASGGTIATGAFWFAPVTLGGTLILGNTTGVASLAGISAADITLGAAAIPGAGTITTAGSIVVAGTFDGANLPLRLLTTGGIDGASGSLRDVLSLTGGAAGDVVLSDGGNTIGNLDMFAVAGTGHGFALRTASALQLTGPVTAPGSIDICACGTGALTVAGTVAAGLATTLGSGGALALTSGARATGTLIALSAGNGIDLQAGARVGQAGAIVDLATTRGGVTQDAGATLIAATLRSAAGVAGDVALNGTANAIGAIGPFAVSGQGFTLLNTGSVAVTGPLTAPGDIRIATDAGGGIGVTGSVVAGGTLSLAAGTAGMALQGGAFVAAPRLILTAAAPITLTGNASLGQSGATVDLSTTAGGIIQSDGATIVAGSLRSGQGVTGDVVLTGSANAIGALADLAVTGGTFSLGQHGPLLVAGTLTADQIDLTAGTIDVTEQITSGVGTVTLLTTIGTIGQDGLIDAATHATLTSATALNQAGTITAGGSVMLSAGTSLTQGGTIVAALGGTLSAATDLLNSGTVLGIGTSSAARLVATTGTLSQSGTLQADSIEMIASAGAITHDGWTEARAGSAVLTAASGVTQSGGAILATNGGVTIQAGASFTQTAGTIAANGSLDGLTVAIDVPVAGAVTGVTQAAAGLIESTGPGGVVTIAAATGLTLAGTVRSPDAQGTVAVAGTLATNAALTLDGTVSAGAAATLSANGNVTVNGLAAATGSSGIVGLTSRGGNVILAGRLASGGTLGVTAASGSILHGGTAQSGAGGLHYTAGPEIRQTGGTILSAGSIDLTAAGAIVQSGGTIQATGSGVAVAANGGGFTQAGGAGIEAAGPAGHLTITATQNLAIAGTMRAGDPQGVVDARAGTALVQDGMVTAGAAITLIAVGDLSNTGKVEGTTTGSAVTLQSQGGNLAQAGTVMSAGSVGESAGGTLTHSGFSQAGALGLTLTAGGDLAQTAGSILSSGSVDVVTGGSLTQTNATIRGTGGGFVHLSANGGSFTQGPAGSIVANGSSASIDIAVATGLTQGGTLVAAGPITVNAAGITQQGLVSGGTSVAFSATGDLLQAGTVSAGTDLSFTAGGALTQTGGLTAGSALGLSAGTLLSQAGDLSAGADAVLTAGTTLAQDGQLTAGGSATLNAVGTLDQSGTLSAGGAVLLRTANNLTQGGVLSAGTDASLRADGAVTQTGTIAAGGAGSLTAGGSLTQDGTVTTGGAATLAAGSMLAQNGRLSASGNASASAGTDLTQTGIIAAGGAGFLTAGGSLTQDGTVTTGGAATLAAGSTLSQAGAVRAGTTATITAPGDLTQTGTLSVPGGSATLATITGALLQTGTIEAGRIVFASQAGAVTISGQLTGLTPSRLQSQASFAIAQSLFPTPGNDTGIFIQAGSATAPAIAQNIRFDASASATTGNPQLAINVLNNQRISLGVAASNLDLFLSLRRGAAAGEIDVASLHVGYQAPGTASSVELSGVVAGLSGYNAASASFIQPLSRENYLLNGCPVQSFNCVQITTVQIPVTNPLQDVQAFTGRSGSSTLFSLPDVAERDF